MLGLKILAVSESFISPSVQNVSVLLPLALCHTNWCEFYFCGHIFFQFGKGSAFVFQKEYESPLQSLQRSSSNE